MKTRFVVIHHVDLHDTLFNCDKARQDGSMVGCVGHQGPHDGWYEPSIVLKGKRINFEDKTSLGSIEVTDFEKNGVYTVLEDWREARYPTKLTGGKLILVGKELPKERHALSDLNEPKPEAPNDRIRHLFPPPQGMEDTVQVHNVTWQKWVAGWNVGQIDIGTGFDFGLRVAIRDSAGRVNRLEDIVPGLKNYEARGIHWIEKNWILISANRKVKNDDYLTIGYGTHLFWIEAR